MAEPLDPTLEARLRHLETRLKVVEQHVLRVSDRLRALLEAAAKLTDLEK